MNAGRTRGELKGFEFGTRYSATSVPAGSAAHSGAEVVAGKCSDFSHVPRRLCHCARVACLSVSSTLGSTPPTAAPAVTPGGLSSSSVPVASSALSAMTLSQGTYYPPFVVYTDYSKVNLTLHLRDQINKCATLRFPASQYVFDLARSPRNTTACTAPQHRKCLALGVAAAFDLPLRCRHEACPASCWTLRSEPPCRNDARGPETLDVRYHLATGTAFGPSPRWL